MASRTHCPFGSPGATQPSGTASRPDKHAGLRLRIQAYRSLIRMSACPYIASPLGAPIARVSRGTRLRAAARRMRALLLACIPVLGLAKPPPVAKPLPPGYSVPVVDLANDDARRVIVDRQAGQYLGHPTTVLLEDQKTLLCVYPEGHGKGPIRLRRSIDAGLTWSTNLPVPASWATSRETPTIHRVVDARGTRRLVVFSGLYPIRSSLSEDDGASWTELIPVGEWGGIVAMASVERMRDKPGHYLAFFHDDGRFIRARPEVTQPVTFTVYASESADGGITWGPPRVLLSRQDIHPCEPGIVRSPDGREIAMLLRENSRRRNSWLITSRDEGRTWSEPRELPAALTGDRHVGRYAPDGRLFVSFRDMARTSATRGDWVAWMGRYEDLVRGREGQCRIRLMDNLHAYDCAYPGVEALPDGTLVATTYGHWDARQPPYIVSVRLRLAEVDARLRRR